MMRLLHCAALMSLGLLVRLSINSREFASQVPKPAQSTNQLEVRLSSSKRTFLPGEPVILRVEIWNRGQADIFVPRAISMYGSEFSSLKILLHHGSSVDGPNEVVSTDYLPQTKNDRNRPPLTEVFDKYWVALSPGNFYGKEIVLDLHSYKRLSKPGRYMINGIYQSTGFFVPDDFGNPLYSYRDELKTMPYPAWRGDVTTNSIWIEIVKP